MLATPAAVVAGIAYNFLPFMTLPIYVSLEKIDIRLVEAAKDLFAGPWRPGGAIAGAIVGGAARRRPRRGASSTTIVAHRRSSGSVVGVVIGSLFLSESFLRVVLPLSLPGVFAGSLLTFIPAMGDFVNAELLGNTADPDDRQRHPEPVPREQRLPDGRRPELHPHGRHPGRRRRSTPGCSGPKS